MKRRTSTYKLFTFLLLFIGFLRHIERTKVLVHVVDAASVEGRDPVEDIRTINVELKAYNPSLLERPQVIAANKVEEKLGEYYSKFGFSGSNTYFTFNTDGTFAAKIDGKSWQGNYTFDEKTHAIQMKGLLLSMSGYATKTTNGISLLFDQKKLLNLIKTMGALKGSSTLSAIGTIANNYDGMRVGFEMTK